MQTKIGQELTKRHSGGYDYYGGQTAKVVRISEHDARHVVVQFRNGREFWINTSNSEWKQP